MKLVDLKHPTLADFTKPNIIRSWFSYLIQVCISSSGFASYPMVFLLFAGGYWIGDGACW